MQMSPILIKYYLNINFNLNRNMRMTATHFLQIFQMGNSPSACVFKVFSFGYWLSNVLYIVQISVPSLSLRVQQFSDTASVLPRQLPPDLQGAPCQFPIPVLPVLVLLVLVLVLVLVAFILPSPPLWSLPPTARASWSQRDLRARWQ